ncbi:DUF3131 domain-containing protein [Candidatus Bathyarchaeota archaeon]|nr:DUF3131 domain-containing protein [Candidatus Bathyarchaeota archaeon]
MKPFTRNRLFYLYIFILMTSALNTKNVIKGVNNVGADSLSSDLMGYAEVAWEYFDPGVGVNSVTGLNYGSFVPPSGGWKCLTDWDLGCYVMAILDAERLGILDKGGTWGADYRIEKVLSFLEDRELHEDDIPCLSYDSTDGEINNPEPTNKYDTGRLLVALHHLKKMRPSLTNRIDDVVHLKCNYISMAGTLSSSPNPENYYIAKGFSYFGFNGTNIQDAMTIPEEMINGPTVDIYGIDIPDVKLISEQVLHTMFEVETDSDFWEVAYRTYIVQEKRWEATGEYTAFTEGNIETSPYYIYEYINSPPNTWYITAIGHGSLSITPIAYLKAALGFHAIYDTSYTQEMVDYLTPRLETVYGYKDGVDEDGSRVDVLSDKTNSLIINAVRYALKKPIKDFDKMFEENSVSMIYPSDDPGKPLVLGPAMLSDWTASGLVYTKLGNVSEGVDTNPLFVDQATGRPYGDTGEGVITFGGPDVNLVTYWAEVSGSAPIHFVIGADSFSFEEKDGTIIPGAELPISVINFDEDMFVIEVFQDEDLRNFMVIQGFGWKGSYAGGKFFDRQIYPNIDDYYSQWVIVKWEDTNSDGFVNAPGDGDTYTVIAEG